MNSGNSIKPRMLDRCLVIGMLALAVCSAPCLAEFMEVATFSTYPPWGATVWNGRIYVGFYTNMTVLPIYRTGVNDDNFTFVRNLGSGESIPRLWVSPDGTTLNALTEGHSGATQSPAVHWWTTDPNAQNWSSQTFGTGSHYRWGTAAQVHGNDQYMGLNSPHGPCLIMKKSGSGSWSQYGPLVTSTQSLLIMDMQVFNGQLYASGGRVDRWQYSDCARVVRYNSATNNWDQVFPINDGLLAASAVFDGKLWVGSVWGTKVYSTTNGTTWTEEYDFGLTGSWPGVDAMMVYKDRLYVAAYNGDNFLKVISRPIGGSFTDFYSSNQYKSCGEFVVRGDDLYLFAARVSGGTAALKYTSGSSGPPGSPSNPNPPDTSSDVGLDATLSWTAGSGATSHNVYFGTTAPPAFQENTTGTSYDPGPMDPLTTYYWKIEAINDQGETFGELWQFTTTAEEVIWGPTHTSCPIGPGGWLRSPNDLVNWQPQNVVDGVPQTGYFQKTRHNDPSSVWTDMPISTAGYTNVFLRGTTWSRGTTTIEIEVMIDDVGWESVYTRYHTYWNWTGADFDVPLTGPDSVLPGQPETVNVTGLRINMTNPTGAINEVNFQAGGANNPERIRLTGVWDVGPPTITDHPSDQSKSVGETATFSVMAEYADGYQWKVNDGSGWADIDSATAPEYTTPTLTAADDGNQYRCVVWNTYGSVESAPATLTVTVLCADPVLLSAYSVMNHGAAGDFAVEIELGEPYTIEPRAGVDHRLLFVFDQEIDITDADVALSSGEAILSLAGTHILVATMTTLPDNNECLTITVSGVKDATGVCEMTPVTVYLTMIQGEVDDSPPVNLTDLSIVRAELYQAVTLDKFMSDVNADGVINLTDLSLVRDNLYQQATCP